MQLNTQVGMIFMSIGLVTIVYVLAPLLLRTAFLLAGSLIAVVVLDLAFRLGVLYSLFSVALGLVIVTVFLTRKNSA
jgi:hypothetical protein